MDDSKSLNKSITRTTNRSQSSSSTSAIINTWKELESMIVASCTKENYFNSGAFGTIYKITINSCEYFVKKLYAEKHRVGMEIDIMTDPMYKHENIISAEYYFFYKDCSFVIMEKMHCNLDWILYSDGGQKYMQFDQPKQIFNILLQTARGIHKLHSEKVIHCDIMPSNIIINYKQVDDKIEIEELKIFDFCLSKRGSLRYTMCGTFAYMAPDICCPSLEGYTSKVDVYSFGVLLGEVICHKRSDGREKFTYKLFKDRKYEDLYGLYKKCTNFTPSERANIEEVIIDLVHIYCEKVKLVEMERKLAAISREIIQIIENIEWHCIFQHQRIEKLKTQHKLFNGKGIKELKDELHKMKEEKIHNILKYKEYWDELEVMVKKEDMSLKNIEELALSNKNTFKELLEKADKLRNSIEKICQSYMFSLNKQMEYTASTFEINLRKVEIEETNASYGTVNNVLISIEDCLFSNNEKRKLVGSQNEFIIQLKEKGNRTIQFSVPPNITIEDFNQQLVAYKKECNETGDALKISHHLETTGPYRIAVTMNGQHLKNSPFTVLAFFSPFCREHLLSDDVIQNRIFSYLLKEEVSKLVLVDKRWKLLVEQYLSSLDNKQ